MVAHLGVHGIGEVEGRGAAPQAHDLPLGREDEDLVLEEIRAQILEKLTCLPHVLVSDPVQAPTYLVYPRVDALVIVTHLPIRIAGPLVEPVGGYAVLGRVVHLVGTDLYLDGMGPQAYDRRVQGLVAVSLWRRDVVLEANGQRVP